PVQVLDVTTVEELQESNKVRTRTVALVGVEGVPAFDLRPRSGVRRLLGVAGVAGVTFDPSRLTDPAAAAEVARFGELFHLMPSVAVTMGLFGGDFAPEVEDSERALRRLFTPRVIRAFNRYPGYSAQAAEGTLAVWRGESFLAAGGRSELLDTALALRAALTEAAAATRTGGTEAVVPALPGTDAESQAARLRNTMIGGIAGFFLGFSAGMAGVSSIFFSNGFRNAGWTVFAMPVILFGSVALGVALGAFLGSRLPVKPATGDLPALRLTPQQRAARRKVITAGTMAGFVLGFFGGFAVFVSVLFGLRQRDPNVSLMALLFFGSLGLGAAAGAYLGGAAARSLHDRHRARRDVA
ncbi:MAG TPA: hypothetical protein VGH33_15825, partial [Isosphaeraceae bacterium]